MFEALIVVYDAAHVRIREARAFGDTPTAAVAAAQDWVGMYLVDATALGGPEALDWDHFEVTVRRRL